MNKKIELEEYIEDFISINRYRVLHLINTKFDGNVDKFYSAPYVYEKFIKSTKLEKQRTYNNHIYSNMRLFNWLGYTAQDMNLVFGNKYRSKVFMDSVRAVLKEKGITFYNKGTMVYTDRNDQNKKIKEPFSPKFIPDRKEIEEIFANKKTLEELLKIESGGRYNNRQIRLIKHFLHQTEKEEQSMKKEQTEQNGNAVFTDSKLADKSEAKKKNTVKKILNTKFKNEIVKEVLEALMPKIEEMIERKCGDHYLYVKDNIADLVEEHINKIFIKMDGKESEASEMVPDMKELDSELSSIFPSKDTAKEVQNKVQNMDDDIDENNSTEDISKWMPDRFIAFVQKGVEKQAVGINVLNSWKCIFTDNDFQELYHRCNEQYKNPSFEVNKKNKLNFYKKLLPYLENENFLRFTMPKTKWDDEAGHSVADKQILNSVICEIRKSINMLERN